MDKEDDMKLFIDITYVLSLLLLVLIFPLVKKFERNSKKARERGDREIWKFSLIKLELPLLIKCNHTNAIIRMGEEREKP